MKWIMLTVVAVLSLCAHTASAQQLDKAIFAGGCFWCVESDFDKVPGVVATISGYTGGKTENPTYDQVTAGGTGHYEAVEITYDPAKVGYEALLTAFWRSVDPTDGGGQFCDRGQSYQTAVFVANEKQRGAAGASKKSAQKLLDKPIVTRSSPQRRFTPQKIITRTIMKRTRAATNFTAGVAAATKRSSKSGANMPTRASPATTEAARTSSTPSPLSSISVIS